MTISQISIQARVIREVQGHCLRQLPQEGCGILAGRKKQITCFFPIPNQDHSPDTFSFEPRTYLDTIRKMRTKKLDWLGVVHSHPETEPYPSSLDIANWHYPELSYWILSLKSQRCRLSAYIIQNGHVTPISYRIVTNRCEENDLDRGEQQ